MQYAFAFIVIILFGLGGGVTSGTDKSKTQQQVTSAGFTELSSTIRGTESISDNKNSSNNRTSSSEESPERSELVDLSLPKILTLSVQDIEYNSVKVRARVDMRSHTDGLVFVVYGYNEKGVTDFAEEYKNSLEIPEFDNDKLQTKIIDRRAKGLDLYDSRLSRLVQNTKYYYRICSQHTLGVSIVTCGQVSTFTTNLRDLRSNNFREPNVNADKAINITGYTAELKGDISMNDGISGIAFFVYGESENLIDLVDKNNKYSDIEESDEFLQKVRLATRLLGRSEYSLKIGDLDLGTEYYFRLCVEYDGDKNGLKCSSVRSFTTDLRNRDDIPSVNTKNPIVFGNSVQLSGGVNMLDFNDGLVFFIYGTNFDRVTEAQQEGSFNRIRQASDSIQRLSIDNDLDGRKDYKQIIHDLNQGKDYYYSLCVEYEDEDEDGREIEFLSCSRVGNFLIP